MLLTTVVFIWLQLQHSISASFFPLQLIKKVQKFGLASRKQGMFFATPLKNETWGNNKMYTRVWRCFMAKHNRKKITFCRAITSLYMHYSCNSTTFISYMLVTYSRCEPITYFLFSSMDSCQLLLLMFNPTRNFLLLFICRF